MSIGVSSVFERPHRVTLQNPGPPVADGDGGFTQTWTDLVPSAMSASIETATADKLEKLGSATAISLATHIVSMPYHPQVTTKTRILFNGRTFNVTGVSNPDERNVNTVAICAEVVA